ncbi:MAG TPA: PH domain-containing protein, partial [Candidatus Gallacutalibacter pullicola]|nr:PH domain-containing protein [Candidatus Gallacutalibacter pullicola]
AAAWSSPASGLMFTGLALQRAGRILGEEFSRPVYDTVSRGFRIAILGIPPAVTGIGVLLAIGWLIALLRDFLKYAGFTVWTRPNGLMFLRGLLHRREYVRKSAVRAAVFQQTLPLYLMRRGVLSLYPAGKGKRGASPLLLPRLCRDPFPKSTVRPSLRSLPSYLTLPGILLLLALVLIWLVDSRLLASLLLPLLIPAGWLAAFRTASWHRAGIAVRRGRIFLHGFHRMRLYTAAIPIGEIRQIRLIQNPFQQCSGTCTVRLYAGTAAQQFFEVKQIDMKQARAILSSCEREH